MFVEGAPSVTFTGAEIVRVNVLPLMLALFMSGTVIYFVVSSEKKYSVPLVVV